MKKKIEHKGRKAEITVELNAMSERGKYGNQFHLITLTADKGKYRKEKKSHHKRQFGGCCYEHGSKLHR